MSSGDGPLIPYPPNKKCASAVLHPVMAGAKVTMGWSIVTSGFYNSGVAKREGKESVTPLLVVGSFIE